MNDAMYAGAMALSLMAGLTAAPSARAQASDVFRPAVAAAAGAVYTATNGVDRNEVYAYRRTADGSLIPLGAFSTGGRGSGGGIDPLQSQHSLVLSDDHRFLFAVNSGSGDVSSFTVLPGGRLALTSVAPSGGGFPVSLAVQGNLLYVLNSGGAGSVSGFRVRRSGRLEPLDGSTRLLSRASAGGASIDFSADGRFLAATERLSGLIDLFPVDGDGLIGAPTQNPSSGKVPFSLSFTPQGALVVTEANGGANGLAALSSYLVTGSALSPVTASLPTGFAAACWSEVSPDGHYVYVANAASGEVTVSSVSDGGVLTPLSAASTGAGSVPLDLALSGNGRFLYALTAGTGTITAFRVEAGGGLTGLSATPSLPAASGQNGLAAY